MKDNYSISLEKIRIAAVQAESIFLNLEKTTDKACQLIAKASANGAHLIAFPEGYLPTFPSWYECLGDTDFTREMDKALFLNAVQIDGYAMSRIKDACAKHAINAVIGINERLPHTTGTLFNTQVHISESGDIIGKHQKYMPTIGERQIHGQGRTGYSNTFLTRFGMVSGLICGENSNPLAQYAAACSYPVVHVASWPSFFATPWPMHNAIHIASASLAYTLKTFVVSSVSRISNEFIEIMEKEVAVKDSLIQQRIVSKGAAIFHPNGSCIACGDGDENELLFADIDLNDIIIPKMVHDVAGHYNRPELFLPLFDNYR